MPCVKQGSYSGALKALQHSGYSRDGGVRVRTSPEKDFMGSVGPQVWCCLLLHQVEHFYLGAVDVDLERVEYLLSR